jgi:hypothetical protein
VALIGETGTGKSRALETFWQQHPPERLDDGMYVPILRVQTPSMPTVKGLAAVMLEGLGAEDPDHEKTENERTRRLNILMKGTQTRMVMLDEFQHFEDKGSQKIMYHVADWLKILVDNQKCALVVSGLPTCSDVIDQNVQLARRFLAPVHLSRFRWADKDERVDFVAILNSFDETLRGCQFQTPELVSQQMAFRFYLATGGLIGYVAKLLRQAVRNAVSEGRTEIGLKHFDAAHIQSMWREPGFDNVPRPFQNSFAPEPTNEVLDQAWRLGTVLTPIDPTPRTRRRKLGESANACLVAR